MARFWATLFSVLLLVITPSYQTLITEEKAVLENQESFDATTIVAPFYDEVPIETITELDLANFESTKDKTSLGTKKTEFLHKQNEKKQIPNKGKKPSPYLIELDSTRTVNSPIEDKINNNETHSANADTGEKTPMSLHGTQDPLQTSESRQRSKIEVKEVNGTLYEYEYVYYYDDEYPLYDYDTPSITGDSNSTTAESLTSKKKASADAQSLSSIVDESGVSTPGQSEHELQSVADNEILSQGFAEPRHLDNIAAENNFELLQAEGGQLPAQTRFPPRSTAPPLEFVTDENLRISLPDSSASVLPSEGRQKAAMADEKAAIDLYAFSKLEDKNFEESSTKTIDYDVTTESPNYFDSFYEYDITAGDLEDLGLLTTSDADQTADFITTANDLFPTEEPSTTTTSTTTTTTTTTTPTPTTTTTTTTEEPSTSRTRSFGGRNRASLSGGRGFSRQRGVTSNDITTNQSKEPTKPESDSSTPASLHGRRRFNRPNLGDRKLKKEEDQPTEPKISSGSETETETPVKETPNVQTRGRFNRRKPPTLRNRNNLKPTAEASTDIQEKQIEEAPETVSKAPRQPLVSSNSRQRRPLGRNRLFNRFNAQNADPVEKTATEQDEAADSVSEVPSSNTENAVEEPKEQSSTTTEKNLRLAPRKNHRFNVDNRRRVRNRKEDRLPPTKTEATASETAQETIPEEDSATAIKQLGGLPLVESKAEEEPAESPSPPGRANIRRRNNRKNLGRLNHRFKNKQEASEKAETQNAEPVAPTASDDPSVDSTADQQVQEEEAGVSPSQSGAINPVSKFSRTSNRENPRKNRFQNRRKQKSTLLPSLVDSPQAEATPEAPEANIEEPPVEPDVNPEISEAEQVEQAPSPDHAVEENVTEVIEPQTTTEKLTRRQQLALRRNKFLHTG